MTEPKPAIVLASTSAFRKKSLAQLGIDFLTVDPAVDETPLSDEQAPQLAIRLARSKALAVASEYPEAIVIAGDQVLAANNKIYGKPGDHANALKQLTELAGQSGIFHSAMCVSFAGKLEEVSIPTTATWRKLSTAQLTSYIEQEPSFASAGSAQLENFGIALVSELSSDDPTAILGLPLISLVTILSKLGRPVL